MNEKTLRVLTEAQAWVKEVLFDSAHRIDAESVKRGLRLLQSLDSTVDSSEILSSSSKAGGVAHVTGDSEFYYPDFPGDPPAPLGTQLLSLNEGGVCHKTVWLEGMHAWAPLPKRNKKKEAYLEEQARLVSQGNVKVEDPDLPDHEGQID